MVTKQLMVTAVAGLGLWAGFGSVAQAQLPVVTAQDAVKVQPRQKGVKVSTPTPDLVGRCSVTPIPNKADPKTPLGYVVRDPSGNAVRQFVSYDGKTFNIIAFYLDGVEAYREVYPPQPGEPYQFRWLGPNGTKWGLDRDRDGRIDEWVVISPEELSQELFQAVLDKDTKRAEALLVTKANLEAIGLHGPKAQAILDRAAGAVAKVVKAHADLKASPEAHWDHLQLGIPQAESSDSIAARDDLVTYKGGMILIQDGKEARFLQTGELMLVGRAWKLIDGPSVGGQGLDAAGLSAPPIPDSIRDLVARLDGLDKAFLSQPANAATLAAHNAKRVEILEQIVATLPPAQQETWTKLLIEGLSAAAEGEPLDGKHVIRLKQFKEAFARPGSPNPAIGSYAWFRYLLTENSIALANAKPGELPAIQERWRAALEEFLAAYPNSADSPEAALRLGMAYEFLNTKEGDAKAKEWYRKLAANPAGHPHADKAAGAIKRLDSEGQPLELAGPTLADGKPFNVASLSGKVVVVYYWASWSSTLPDDAKKLNALLREYGPKGVELVTVSLDSDARVAAQAVATHNLPGIVLHAPGGLDASPLAAQYGIIVVPHLFVANKQGKIVNRNAQVVNLEDEVKKLLP